MTKNKTISNNTIDIVSVRHRRYEDFSMVPTKPYWPCNGYFFFIDNTSISSFVLKNLELIYDIGFRIFKVDEDIALVINAYSLSYDIEYFLPLYELLVSNRVVHL